MPNVRILSTRSIPGLFYAYTTRISKGFIDSFVGGLIPNSNLNSRCSVIDFSSSRSEEPKTVVRLLPSICTCEVSTGIVKTPDDPLFQTVWPAISDWIVMNLYETCCLKDCFFRSAVCWNWLFYYKGPVKLIFLWVFIKNFFIMSIYHTTHFGYSCGLKKNGPY